jgi:capsular polysaccharide transport system ATP-binding protein
MIRFINVSKYFVTPVGRHYVFRDVSIELPLDKNVGVIGPNGSGKSTFLRLLAGADHPSSGVIKKSGSISPPMGLTPVLQKSLSALENVRFAGRIYGMKKPEIDRMIDYVRELAGIGAYFEMPVETYSAGMRQKVAFGINMSMHFDYYLFDEISAGGDREFRKMARAKVAERLRTSRFLMTSHDTRELLELCDAGIVIKDGKLNYFDDIRDAAMFYGDDIDTDGNTAPRRGRFRRAKEHANADGAERPAGDEARERRRRKRDGRLRAGKRKAALPSPDTSSQLVLGDVSPAPAGSLPLPWDTPLTPHSLGEQPGRSKADRQIRPGPVPDNPSGHAFHPTSPEKVSRGT